MQQSLITKKQIVPAAPTGTIFLLANAAIVPAGPNGAISIFVTNDCDVIIDVNGYFAP